jgi:membrane protein implicated in regulation of membrane protease activity
MDWTASTAWWALTGLLIAIELATGTFYLLMLAVGSAAAALSTYLDVGTSAQVGVAAVIGMVTTASWHLKRRRDAGLPAEADRAVNLDIGQTVNVPGWSADGTAQVQYRGAAWSVAHQGHEPPMAGEHVIVALDGNRLIVTPRR